MERTHYLPTWESIHTHTLPKWFDDCKLGIFIHWGLYSVPAWAEITWELGGEPSDLEWFTHNPYAEWYLNTIRIPNSPARIRHDQVYGEDFPYEKFADLFTCEKWNPVEWAQLFKKSGAGYVVLTTKHHDGFCLYPSAYTAYNSMNRGAKRDLMGELTEAVRAQGLRMGAYYSGLLDWTTHPFPMTRHYCMDAYNHTFAFSDYSLNQTMELVDKYKPDVLWNDIGWPEKGQGDLPYLFSHYYNTVPQGAINDRWYCSFNDFTTAEYLRGEKTFEKKWEMCRGLGLSFGYNQNENPENILSGTELVRLLIQYVSHNGNLLINIGPRADGTIPELQATRLLELGAWLEKHGEAIYGTRPWPEHPQEQLLDGITAYYTRKGNDLFVVFDGCTPGLHTLRIDCYPQEITVEVPDEYPVHYRLPHYFN